MTGPPKKPDIVRLWVEKAEHDLLNIDNNLTASKVPWDTVCFHAQQGAE
jgi:HEPN domain-containing protein